MGKTLCLVVAVYMICCACNRSFQEETGSQHTAGSSTALPAVAAHNKIESVRDQEEPELRKIVQEAWPIFDNILNSINDGSYEQHIRDFSPALKAAYRDKDLFCRLNAQQLKTYGAVTGRSINKIVKRNPYYCLYYWVRFSKAEQPVTAVLNLEEKGGALQVAFLQFQFSGLQAEQSGTRHGNTGQ